MVSKWLKVKGEDEGSACEVILEIGHRLSDESNGEKSGLYGSKGDESGDREQ